MAFSKQEYWLGLPFSAPGIVLTQARRDQEGIRGSEQAVHRTLVFPSSETRVSGNFCGSRLPIIILNFKMERGASPETL